MADRDRTPPHRPTYDVRLSDLQIEDIFNAAFHSPKDLNISTISELPRGQSFNNRIYFVQTEQQGISREYALKVSGKFFNGAKVENEVGSLLLLQHYCPDVPVPRIVAWSLDGSQCEHFPWIFKGNFTEIVETVFNEIASKSSQYRSWILMEKLPGKRLEVENLTPEQSSSLMRSLAGHVHAWRTQMPDDKFFGNLRLANPATGPSGDDQSFEVKVQGLVLCESIDANHQMETKVKYVSKRLEDAIQTVLSKTSFSEPHRRKIQQSLQESQLMEKLQTLSIFKEPNGQRAVFTHNDFSPRNMLFDVDEKTGESKLTGILDFEFSGFFPTEEEFTNDTIANAGDWPLHLYQLYLDELEKLGCQVPNTRTKEESNPNSGHEADRKLFSAQSWKQAQLFARLIENIAPWQISAGSYSGDELNQKLADSVDRFAEDLAEILEFTNPIDTSNTGEL